MVSGALHLGEGSGARSRPSSLVCYTLAIGASGGGKESETAFLHGLGTNYRLPRIGCRGYFNSSLAKSQGYV